MTPTPQTDPLLADAPVVGRYVVLDPAVLVRRLGEGGMAAVYQGVHLRLKIPVAVKVLKRFPGDRTMNAVDRFNLEAEQAARLSHDNVVRVFDFGVDPGGLHYLVMEYVDGETVEARVRRRKRLSPAEAATIAYHAAAGLRHAHGERVVHRDVKPANILVGRDGRVKLADLGIAKAADPARAGATQENIILGTPQYMAPELWRGARNATPASDVYALGATLGFMLAGGHLLGDGEAADVMRRALMQGFPDVRTLAPDCPPVLADLVARATVQMPAGRPAAADLMAALRAFLRDFGGAAELADLRAGGGPAGPLPDAAELTEIRRLVAARGPQRGTGSPSPPTSASPAPSTSPAPSASATPPPTVVRPRPTKNATDPAAAPPPPPPPPAVVPIAPSAAKPRAFIPPGVGPDRNPGRRAAPPTASTAGPAGRARPVAPRRAGDPTAGGGPTDVPTPLSAVVMAWPHAAPATVAPRRPKPPPSRGRRWAPAVTAVVAAVVIVAAGAAEASEGSFLRRLRPGSGLVFLPWTYLAGLLGVVAAATAAAASVPSRSRLAAFATGWSYAQVAGVGLGALVLGPTTAVVAAHHGGQALPSYFVAVILTVLASFALGVVVGAICWAVVTPTPAMPPPRKSPAGPAAAAGRRELRSGGR